MEYNAPPNLEKIPKNTRRPLNGNDNLKIDSYIKSNLKK